MPLPFPGMNPHLQQQRAWSDFHESFMPAARDALDDAAGYEHYIYRRQPQRPWSTGDAARAQQFVPGG